MLLLLLLCIVARTYSSWCLVVLQMSLFSLSLSLSLLLSLVAFMVLLLLLFVFVLSLCFLLARSSSLCYFLCEVFLSMMNFGSDKYYIYVPSVRHFLNEEHGDRIVVMFALIDRIIAIAIAVGGCRFGPWARERSSQIAVQHHLRWSVLMLWRQSLT